MSSDDDDFLRQLRATFRVEADEHLQAISAGLLELEKTPADTAAVETIFRAAHSLKGAARAVDFRSIESLCQSLEDVFASWKLRESAPTAAVLDTLHRALDAIRAGINDGKAQRDAGGEHALHALSLRLRQLGPGISATRSASPVRESFAPYAEGIAPVPAEVSPPAPAPVAPAPPHAGETEQTVRIAVAKLEAQILESEEMLTAKLAAGQRVSELRGLLERLATWRAAWMAIEPEVRQLRQSTTEARLPSGGPALSALLDFFESSLDTLKSIESSAALLTRAADQDRQSVTKLVDDLLNDSKNLLLLPFATISTAFHRLVRDISREQGKETDLSIRGEDIQIDKRILEDIKDPLVHLLRNSIDHGIEAPAERMRHGKPVRATITLDLSQVDGNKVQLLLTDDGCGIDMAKVKAAAVRHKIISAEDAERLSARETEGLIFRSGISTSSMITELSGRGLGLAIVREKVEKLGGEVSVESRSGLGTVFRVVVPARSATFRGILIEAAGRVLVVPTAQVERVTRIQPDNIVTIEGRETISLAGRALPLVRLADALELPAAERADRSLHGEPALVLGTGDQRVAFAVDTVLDEQEILIKLLRKPLLRIRNVAAATVLGSGVIAPVLNVADLLKSARKGSVAGINNSRETGEVQAHAGNLLVAEDSITSRMLIKNILESAGYRVKTAVDGAEAYAALRSEDFDLLVSDVEMPRLNGFDLTARIRADPKLKDLPVVLVTALETREDRERGIDVGANAYLIKSSFDQSNLLEAVKRLI